MGSDSRLILSQDYELFFDKSGSLEKCLFEPCAALLDFADKHDSKVTFFVDAGMLLCMERHVSESREMRAALDQVMDLIDSVTESDASEAASLYDPDKLAILELSPW